MSQKRVSMRKIRELLRLKYELGRSHSEIATSLGIANKTVSHYVRRATGRGLLLAVAGGAGRHGAEDGAAPAPRRLHGLAGRSRARRGGGSSTWSCGRSSGPARRRSSTTRARSSRWSTGAREVRDRHRVAGWRQTRTSSAGSWRAAQPDVLLPRRTPRGLSAAAGDTERAAIGQDRGQPPQLVRRSGPAGAQAASGRATNLGLTNRTRVQIHLQLNKMQASRAASRAVDWNQVTRSDRRMRPTATHRVPRPGLSEQTDPTIATLPTPPRRCSQ